MNKLYLYLLSGIASVVRLGRRGNTLRSEANHIEFRDPGNALLRVKTGNAQQLDDAVSLQDLRDRVLLNYGAPVQAISQLLTIPASERRDKQIRYVEDESAYYQFDTESMETFPNEDDPNRIFIPNDLSAFIPGRWIQTRGRTEYHSDLLGLDEGNDHPQYQLRSGKNSGNGYAGLGTEREIEVFSGNGVTGFIRSTLISLATGIRSWNLPDESGTLTTQERLNTEISNRQAAIENLNSSKENSISTGNSNQFWNGLKQWVSIAWGDIAGRPSVFTPSTHANSHLPGGGDSIPQASTSGSGLMSGTDKSKLDGIQSGSTANASNAQLRDRATHTGEQGSETVTGLSAFISGIANTIRNTLLTGLNTGTTGAISATDSILSAFGKLQNQISNFSSGVMTWIQLTDTPASYGANPKRVVQVNSASNGLEFGIIAERQNYIDDPFPASNAVISKWIRYLEVGYSNLPSLNWTSNSHISMGVIERRFANQIGNEADYLINAVGGMPSSFGVRYDFIVERRHLGRVLQVTFDFEYPAFAPVSDYRIFIVQDPMNVNNRRQIIEPVNVTLAKMAVGVTSKHIASFQTGIQETNYAFVIHSVGSIPSSLAISNLKIWEPEKNFGAIITDWQSYTPTTFGGLFPNSVSCFWRRNGSNCEIRGIFTAPGIVTGGNASIALPPGLISLPGINLVGRIVQARNVLPNTYSLYSENGNSFLTVSADDNTSFPPLTSTSWSSLISPNIQLSFQASVPIAGWGSTLALSSDAGDGRVVAARYNNATLPGSTILTYQTLVYDTHSAYSAGVYTAPVNGFYRFSLTLRSSANLQLNVQINESTVETLFDGFNSGFAVTAGSTVFLQAGQRLRILGTGGGGLSSQLSNQSFTIERISTGSQQITPVEFVGASCFSGADQVNLTGQINFGTKVYDSHNAVTTGIGAWKFTAPVSGKYLINGIIIGGSNNNIRLFRNASEYIRTAAYQNVNGSGYLSLVLDLLAGQFFDIRPETSGTYYGSTLLSPYTCQIHITRLGV